MIYNKKIGIFGLGLSGISSLNFLKNKSCQIICWDDLETSRNKIKSNFLIPISSPEWQNLDMIIVTPGISPNHEIFSLASKHGIKISSDIEIFLDINREAEIIVITGTNGKTTLTSLIAHILKNNKIDCEIGGNIGLPVLSLPKNSKRYILELSSFQLDLLNHVNAQISVLLNLYPDHIDRYNLVENYYASKEKILDSDALKIIGVSSEASRKLYKRLYKSGEKKIIPINNVDDINSNNINLRAINCNSNYLMDNYFDLRSYDIDIIQNLRGPHNYENIGAAFAVCRALGVSGENIIKHLQSFQGLEHRMQFVCKYNHISFYNDSKSTNMNSAIASLSALDNIFWLAGGVFKEKKIELTEKSIQNIKKAYLFGESKILFSKYFDKKIDYSVCDNMYEAFNLAFNDAMKKYKITKENVNILLSPACASFDQFANFIDRGNNFISLCNAKFK